MLVLMDINRKVCKCAIELEDSFLLAKLAQLSLRPSITAKVWAALYSKARSAKQVCSGSDDSHLHRNAFAELVAYMEEDFRMEESISSVFKLADLAAKLYQTLVEEFGSRTRSHVHTSRLKLRLLSAFLSRYQGIQCKEEM